ncbi:MAG: glycogen debranching enzyme N-terminal domain-containing protein, partial [Phycisphaerae bacterium]|nr:glycogen debranching enzyme N-terminal domain-containing protein [Phycisphaerae bacterium]
MSSSLGRVIGGCESTRVEIDGDLNELLTREWLITNQIGAYASGTVIGCNTRRYHGLLIASASPPMGRFLALATIMDQATLHPGSPGEKTF